MSGLSQLQEPTVVNTYGLLMSELTVLRQRFGMPGLSIVEQGGKYFLDAEGRLLEIKFANGKIIPIDAMENMQSSLGRVLESHGYSPHFGHPGTSQYGVPYGASVGGIGSLSPSGGYGLVGGIALAGLALGSSGRSLTFDPSAGSSSSNGSALKAKDGPRILSVNSDDISNTVTLEYDRPLNEAKLPSSDDFEILVNGQPVGIARIRITEDKVELELAHDILAGDSVSVRYLDQGTDVEDAIQSVDGALASAFVQVRAIDGYIAGAQVYIDKNGDGVADPDEILEGVVTDSRGLFLLDSSLNPENLPIMIVGGTNIDTGLPNALTLTAPAGSTVITPSTTLIQKMVRDGVVGGEDTSSMIENAEILLKNAIGLPEDVSILSFDPIAAIQGQYQITDAARLHKFNTSVVEILESFGPNNSANFKKAETQLISQIVDKINKNLPVVLDREFTDSIIDSVYPTGNNSQLKSNLAVAIEAIQGANSMQSVAAVQSGVAVVIDSEQITNNDRPVISGSATAGATVTVSVGGATYQVVASNGAWSIDTKSDQPVSGKLDLNINGENLIVASVSSESTDVKFEAKKSLIIDTEAPVAESFYAIADVGNGPTLLRTEDTTNATLVTLTGVNELGSSIEIFDGEVLLGKASVNGSSWEYAVTIEDATTHKFNFRETDEAGNTSASSEYLTITGDLKASTPILVSAYDDFGSVKGALTSGGATDDANILLSGECETGSVVTVFDGDKLLGQATVIGTDWSYLATIDDGSIHNFNVRSTDQYGNVSQPSEKFTIIGDSSSPTPNLNYIVDDVGAITGSLNSGDVTDDSQVQLIGTNEAGSTVEVFDGSTSLGQATVEGENWTFSAAVTDGTTHQFSVRETDVAGNISKESTPFSIIGDMTSPEPKLFGGAVNSDDGELTVLSGDHISSSSIALLGANEIGSTVGIFDGSNFLGLAVVDGEKWSYTAEVLDGFSHSFNVREVDSAGNVSMPSEGFVVVGDMTKPEAVLGSVIDDKGGFVGALTSGDFTDDPSITLIGDNEEGSIVEVFDGSTSIGFASVEGTSWTFDAMVFDGVTHTFNIRETDIAGNQSLATSNFVVVGDMQSPSISAVSMVSDNDVSSVAKVGDSVTITLQTDGSEASTPSITVNSNTVVPTITENVNEYQAVYTLQSGEPEGPISAVIELADAAGNKTTITSDSTDQMLVSFDDYEIIFQGLILEPGASDIDVQYIDSNTVAGTSNSNDSTAALVLEIIDADVDDVLELYADGQEIFSSNLTDQHIEEGKVITPELTFEDPYDQDVLLEVKLQHAGDYVQADGEMTWEYQW